MPYHKTTFLTVKFNLYMQVDRGAVDSSANVELWGSDDSGGGKPMREVTQTSLTRGQTQRGSSSTAKTSVIQFCNYFSAVSRVTFRLTRQCF